MRLPAHSLFALASLFLLTGCFTREVRVVLRPDGSGTLEVTTWVRQALLDYTRRETGIPPEEWWFTENTLQKAAEGYGKGVRYLTHRIHAAAGGQRFQVIYAFEDLRELRIGLDPSLPFFLTPPDRTRNQSLPAYRFSMPEPGNVMIHPPPAPPVPPKRPHVKVEARDVIRQREERQRADVARLMRHGNLFQLTGKESTEELAVALGQDMRFRLVVASATGFDAGNASYMEEGAVVLFDFEIKALLEHEALRKQAGEGTLHQLTWGELARLPGAKVENAEAVLLRIKESNSKTAD